MAGVDSDNLVFQSIVLTNVERMEPAEFSPNVFKYTVYRKPGECHFGFYGLMNQQPQKQTEWWTPPYNKRKLVFDYTNASEGELLWRPCKDDSPTDLSAHNTFMLPPRSSRLWVGIVPEKRYRDEIKVIGYEFNFPEVAISPDEIANCKHPNSYTTSGEVWGGGSGSCQVEMLRMCVICDAQIDRWIEHND